MRSDGASARSRCLYTNDEHGWLAATDDFDGAAGMLGLWRDEEGYTEDGPFLVLSGGDTWTGPAISSWFDGESMVEVMNAMGYDAAAIGNHEFDFGVDGLRARIDQAEFPFLSANIRDAASGAAAEFALPYVIQEVNGVRVGIIGLSCDGHAGEDDADARRGLEFTPYKAALEAVVPQVLGGWRGADHRHESSVQLSRWWRLRRLRRNWASR